MPRRFVLTIAAFCLFASTGSVRAQTAGMLSFQGLIKDNGGQPISGSVTLEFRIFDDQFAGNLVDMDGDGVVENVIGQDAKQVAATAVNGIVSAPFGPVFARSFDGNARYLEVTVNGSPLSRQFMATAPATAEQVNIPGTATPAFHITPQSFIGIGTGAPTAKLHVSGGPYPQFSVDNQVSRGYGIGVFPNGSLRISDVSKPPAVLDRITVDGGGLVGVGTVNPVSRLHVSAGVINPASLQITVDDTTSRTYTMGVTSGEFRIRDKNANGDAGADRLAISGSGHVRVAVLQILGGSDLAEPFEVGDSTDRCDTIEPGMVVVIDPDHPGQLKLATDAYDRKVAGIISGANGLSPGMVMRSEGTEHADGEHDVALTGRVWCWADASFGPIVPGDRLTTSPTRGHAMKVTDGGLADGAVIGKAMTPLRDGRGLVLVLVQPQ